MAEESSAASDLQGEDAGAEVGDLPAAIEGDPELDALKSSVEHAVASAGFDAGVAFVDLSQEDTLAGFGVNADARLVSASMIKLLVLAEFLDEVDAGALSPEEPYTVQAQDIVGGTGSVQSAGAGAVYTLSDLAFLMISESDNVAANVLIERMGMDAVNAQAGKLGLTGTQLNRLMMDEEAQAQRIENFMSAGDAAVLLARIWRGQLVDKAASAFALQALESQTDAAGIAQALPEGVVFAHKTGTLSLVKNDAGIVEADKPYVLAVFCSGTDEDAALRLMDEVSSLVYERFE